MLKAYKLLKLRKDGTLGPLFINRPQRIPTGVWLNAENHPTKGYKQRKGWHCCKKPDAPHLSNKGRIWMEVAIQDYVIFERPSCQGGTWYIAQKMLVVKPA